MKKHKAGFMLLTLILFFFVPSHIYAESLSTLSVKADAGNAEAQF